MPDCRIELADPICQAANDIAFTIAQAVGMDLEGESYKSTMQSIADNIERDVDKGKTPQQAIDDLRTEIEKNFAGVTAPAEAKPKAEIGIGIKFPWWMVPILAVAGVGAVYLIVKG